MYSLSLSIFLGITILKFAHACRTSYTLQNGLRVNGGSSVYPGKYPWQVSLQQWDGSNYIHFCGGSIIANQWILTAAHCLLGESSQFGMSASDGEINELRIMAGKTDLSIQETSELALTLVNVITHENYSPTTMENDIALIQVAAPITFGTSVQAIALPTQNQQFSGSATITGWGATTEGGTSSNILQEVTIPILSDADCTSQYESGLIFPSMICAGTGGQGSCQGDSGGPMSFENGATMLQIGIVSWGKGCANGKPSVLTEVSYFIDWINEQMAAA